MKASDVAQRILDLERKRFDVVNQRDSDARKYDRQFEEIDREYAAALRACEHDTVNRHHNLHDGTVSLLCAACGYLVDVIPSSGD